MKIFNEETGKGLGQSILTLENAKEGRMLVAIVQEACKANSRKTSWKTFKKLIEEKLGCY